MSLYEERKRLEQEDGEPLVTVRITPDFEAADGCNGAGVVVVAGEWGLQPDDEARLLRPLAELGFFVVGIDLVRGERARSATEAAARAETIDPALAIDDISSALLYLKEMASGKIGVVGLDAAASLVLEAATTLPQIDAIVLAGGGLPRKGLRLARTRSSVVLHRGTRSSPLSTDAVAALLDRIRPSGQTLLPYDYDAPDGFFARPQGDEERALATEAWDRTRDFLQQQLVL